MVQTTNGLNPLFLTDGYKLDHRRQYPKGTKFIQANWTPRSDKFFKESKGKVLVFGIQYALKVLLDSFEENFFKKDKATLVKEYQDFVKTYLNVEDFDVSHIEELHDLGYLPIKIRGLEEGSLCPVGTPVFTIINTDERFFWLVNYLETYLSNQIWLPMTSATTAYVYKKRLYKHFKKTLGEIPVYANFLCHDFSMRGMGGVDATIASGMGHLAVFEGSESLPAIRMGDVYYGSVTAGTIPATEHSVMCAGGNETEVETFRRLITEVYPSGFVSIVSDTWNLWRVVTEYVDELKSEILSRDGRLVIRPDSGTPEDIICGKKIKIVDLKNDKLEGFKVGEYFYDKSSGELVLYRVTNIEWSKLDGNGNVLLYVPTGYEVVEDLSELERAEIDGVYMTLWKKFGGDVVNGFKVLHNNIGVIYGDSITIERQAEIYKRLEEKGFAGTNLVLGIGSYTYQYRTRDSLGFAMKSTWCNINGVPTEIFKNPITDDGVKKSAKGYLCVVRDERGALKLQESGDVVENIENDAYVTYLEGDGSELKSKKTISEIRELVERSL